MPPFITASYIEDCFASVFIIAITLSFQPIYDTVRLSSFIPFVNEVCIIHRSSRFSRLFYLLFLLRNAPAPHVWSD